MEGETVTRLQAGATGTEAFVLGREEAVSAEITLLSCREIT